MGLQTAIKRLAMVVAPIVVLGLGVLLGSAQAVVAKAHKRSSCNRPVRLGSESEAEPKELAGPLEASVLANYAVLRRPAQLSDQLPPLNPAGSDLGYELSSYYPGYIRRLIELPDGTRYFVIPAFERAVSIPPAHCLPRSLRPERGKLVEEQRALASEPVYCIVRVGRHTSAGGADCAPFADVDEGRRVFTSAFSQAPVVDLVPDGVASVRIAYHTGTPIVDSVVENAYLFTPRRGLLHHALVALRKLFARIVPPKHPGKAKHLSKARILRLEKELARQIKKAVAEAKPTRIEWLAADGELVRRISPPSVKRHTSPTIIFGTATTG